MCDWQSESLGSHKGWFISSSQFTHDKVLKYTLVQCQEFANMMSSRESESVFNGLNGTWLCFPVGCLWKFEALLFGGIACLSLSRYLRFALFMAGVQLWLCESRGMGSDCHKEITEQGLATRSKTSWDLSVKTSYCKICQNMSKWVKSCSHQGNIEMCSLKQFFLIHFWPSSSVQHNTLDRNCDRIRHSKLRTSHVQKASKARDQRALNI